MPSLLLSAATALSGCLATTNTDPAVTSLTDSLDDDVVMATPGANSLSHDAVDNVISVRHDDVSCTTHAHSTHRQQICLYLTIHYVLIFTEILQASVYS